MVKYDWIDKQKNTRVYEDFSIEFKLLGSTRKELRDSIILKFLEEKPGHWLNGIKHVSRYKYFVERLDDGRRIYLLRPTFLNKGIDFQVWVEKFDKRGDQKPSHGNMISDLKLKRQEDNDAYKNLLEAIDRVWNCEEPDNVIKDIKFTFKSGYSIELILKVLKWLFIEQDITYWNYDGRTMLRMAIDKEVKN